MKKFFALLSFTLFFGLISNSSALDLSYVNPEEDDIEIQIEIANYLAEQGILVDHRDDPTEYKFQDNILRQEIAGTIAIIVGLQENNNCKNLFADVTITEDNSWACPRIESLLENGIVAANTNYRPMDNVSKIEAIGFVLNSLFLEEYEQAKSPDLTWEENAIVFANQKELIFGDVYNRENPASRGFIFTMLYLALEKLEEEGKDVKNILENRKEFMNNRGNILEMPINTEENKVEEKVEKEENNSTIETSEENYENAMLKALNEYRKNNNLPEVKINETLNQAAYNHVKDMVENNYVSHFSQDGRNPADRVLAAGYTFSKVGENIAKLEKFDIDLAMQKWDESPLHKENMLGDFSEVGFGYYNGIFVQVFANPY